MGATILYFVVLLCWKGPFTVEAVTHSTLVWCLIAFGLVTYLEIRATYARRDVARAKDDAKFWMDKAIERQVTIDELRKR